MVPPFLRGRRLLMVLGLLVVLAAGAAAAYFLVVKEPGDVSNPSVSFTGRQQTKKPEKQKKFTWPYYGYDAARTKAFPGSAKLRPPFHTVWSYRQKALLEFPPSIDRGHLFVLQNDGFLVSIRAKDGKVAWRHRLGLLAAASPAVGHGKVWVVILRKTESETSGRVACLRQRDGKILWSKALPSRAESSPLLRHGRLYFGSEDGTFYALKARSGRTLWTYKAGGAIKAGAAYAGGKLYFGDYSGQVYALRAAGGQQAWRSGSGGGYLGRSGQFYSTPAAAFGRIYVGNTDARMYSFAASSGKLAWATRTGAYFYASPAVRDVPGLGPTVYGGSYDGKFYAFNAQTGGVRWAHSVGGKISGGAQIIGDIVYFSDLGDRKVVGVGLKSGQEKFSYPDGAFNPVVADRERLYLIGFGNIYALEHGPKPQHKAAAKVERARAKAKARRHARRTQRDAKKN